MRQNVGSDIGPSDRPASEKRSLWRTGLVATGIAIALLGCGGAPATQTADTAQTGPTTVPRPDPSTTGASCAPRGCHVDEGTVVGTTAVPRGGVLRPDGVGDVDFGVSEDVALEKLGQMFGPPDAVLPSSTCPSENSDAITAVEYSKVFVLGFVDHRFTSWVLVDPKTSSGAHSMDLSTEAGMRLGDRRPDLVSQRMALDRVELFRDDGARMVASVSDDGIVYQLGARAVGWGDCAYRDT